MKLLARDIFEPAVGIHYASYKNMSETTILHSHDFYELFLIAGGSVTHVINGEEQFLINGALVLVRPDDKHAYIKGTASCELHNLAFTKGTFKSFMNYLCDGFPIEDIIQSKLPPRSFLIQAEIDYILLRFYRWTHSSISQKTSLRTEFRALLAELLVKYFLSPIDIESKLPSWLEELCSVMQSKENLQAGMSRMYQLSGRSREHMSRVFKQQLGKTPTQWLNEQRLQLAAHLLTYTDDAILDISLECGYQNLSHFYHQFLKRYQITPLAYRKQHRKPVIP